MKECKGCGLIIPDIEKDCEGNQFSHYNFHDIPATPDMVNNPPHYKQGRFEAIDVIEDAVKDLEGMEAVCIANALKYILRHKHKGGTEDLKKAAWYLNRLTETK